MIVWKYTFWRAAGAAAVLGLAACGGEGGEAGSEHGGGEAGEAGEGAIVAPPAPTSAAVGGEAGEAGAASAYAGLAGDQLTAQRLEHLRGFVLIAQRVAEGDRPEEAAILVQQGLLEVYDPAASEFGALEIAQVRAVGDGAGVSRAEMARRLQAADAAIDAAMAPLRYDHAVLTARMLDIAAGLYQGVVQADYVDTIEYQHSQGAALAARVALNTGEGDLKRQDRRAFEEAQAELNRFVELWPSPAAPEAPASYQQIVAQSSRVRLALSPYL